LKPIASLNQSIEQNFAKFVPAKLTTFSYFHHNLWFVFYFSYFVV